MENVKSPLKMVINILVNLKMECCTAKVSLNGLMEYLTKVILKIINYKEMEYIVGLTIVFIKVKYQMDYDMASEN
jgi:hypothetical protein